MARWILSTESGDWENKTLREKKIAYVNTLEKSQTSAFLIVLTWTMCVKSHLWWRATRAELVEKQNTSWIFPICTYYISAWKGHEWAMYLIQLFLKNFKSLLWNTYLYPECEKAKKSNAKILIFLNFMTNVLVYWVSLSTTI